MSINHSILDYSSAEHIPKKVYSFKSRHLCQWPPGSCRAQVEHSSLVQLSLSASQAIPVTASVSLSYCFAYETQTHSDDRQGSLLPPSKVCLSFFDAIESIFGCRYSGTTSCSKIQAQQQESAREPQDFPSHVGARWDPTPRHGAAPDCSELPLAATPSQGMFQ